MACFLLLEYIFCFLYYPYSKLFSSSSIIGWFSLFFIYQANPNSSTIYTHDSLLKLSEFFLNQNKLFSKLQLMYSFFSIVFFIQILIVPIQIYNFHNLHLLIKYIFFSINIKTKIGYEHIY